MSVLPARILFLDDDVDTCGAMLRLLRDDGYDACCATTCAEAIALAQDAPLDLLITDLLLPDGDGLTVLRRVRQLYPLEAILISGVDEGYASPVQEIEAQHFATRLVKPVEFAHLRKAVTELLDPRRRAALATAAVAAARAAQRARSLREKVKAMTTAELSRLVAEMKRHGDDLCEEMGVINEIVQQNNQSIRQRHSF
jgi:DNA-binding NtrC family response regulator